LQLSKNFTGVLEFKATHIQQLSNNFWNNVNLTGNRILSKTVSQKMHYPETV